jgi:hypothetical protein
LAKNGPGFVAEPAAVEELEADGAFGVRMNEVVEQGDDLDLDAQFFEEFAVEALLEGLAGFAFAARKFPEAGEV